MQPNRAHTPLLQHGTNALTPAPRDKCSGMKNVPAWWNAREMEIL